MQKKMLNNTIHSNAKPNKAGVTISDGLITPEKAAKRSATTNTALIIKIMICTKVLSTLSQYLLEYLLVFLQYRSNSQPNNMPPKWAK